MRRLIVFFLFSFLQVLAAQNTYSISGKVTNENLPLPYANIILDSTTKGAVTDENGKFIITNVSQGTYNIAVSFTGFTTQKKRIAISNSDVVINFELNQSDALDKVIVTGTLKAVSRLESPVPVEVYSPTFLKKNPTPNIFEALQNVNGVRPK